MLFQKYLTLVALCVTGIVAEAQAQAYPKNYFRNPLDIPISLAGNFGECRPNHFHSGMDIKTQGKENIKVYAAADGYISRIKMETGGFGHALYVTHPNGYTTLYAHLNDFVPEVQKFIRQQQYQKENWAVDVPVPADMFPVKKGQQIAWSGNTGSSTAPHLHFEIRNTQTEHPLNPQLFGFDIEDTIAPRPIELAVYSTNQSIYEQQVELVPIRKKGKGYTFDTIAVYSLKTGLGVHANDFMNGSSNTLNFYTATLTADHERLLRIRLDDIGYDVTRYLHAYVDYKARKQTNKWIQLLFQLKDNRLNHIYDYSDVLKAQRGTISFDDKLTKEITIELTDAAGNATTITGMLVYKPLDTMAGACKTPFTAGKPNKFNNKNINLRLQENTLYDDICFTYSKTSHANGYSDIHHIHKSYVPLHMWTDLYITPDNNIPADRRSKVALVYIDGKEQTGKAATYKDGAYTAPIRNFGDYKLVVDSEAPVLTPTQKDGADLSKASRISFTAKDEITSVKNFRGELDGKWLLFEQRGNNWFYEFDEHCPAGEHTLVVTVSDENDNSRTLRYNFTR
ncbi:M23 family metallopeptidase [Polluticoccus soli]|uniref:M23 family metallopeptidase n=1 Tax=Polluticoccus soli TaxID=3034150 RepID=UPI0023E2552C|nr:M23 family metallopeptidase [Flavipsychrobacter sp. JY13-12]